MQKSFISKSRYEIRSVPWVEQANSLVSIIHIKIQKKIQYTITLIEKIFKKIVRIWLGYISKNSIINKNSRYMELL